MRPRGALLLSSLGLLALPLLACAGFVEGVVDELSGPPAPWEGDATLSLELTCEGACASDAAVLLSRLEELGVEHTVSHADATSLSLTLHGVGDVAALTRGWLRPGRLSFHPELAPGAGAETRSGCLPDSSPCEPLSWAAEAALSNGQFESAEVSIDELTGSPVVELHLTEEGRERFLQLSTELVGRKLVAVLDEELLMAPVVQEAIDSPTVQVTVGPSYDLDELALFAVALSRPPLQGSWTLSSLAGEPGTER